MISCVRFRKKLPYKDIPLLEVYLGPDGPSASRDTRQGRIRVTRLTLADIKKSGSRLSQAAPTSAPNARSHEAGRIGPPLNNLRCRVHRLSSTLAIALALILPLIARLIEVAQPMERPRAHNRARSRTSLRCPGWGQCLSVVGIVSFEIWFPRALRVATCSLLAPLLKVTI